MMRYLHAHAVVFLALLSGGTATRPASPQAASLTCDAVIPPSDSGSGRIATVAPGRNGRLAWTDGRPGQFLLRDSTGTTRVIGRAGAGPGEFNGVGGMEWIGDTLWVADFRLPRVQFFSDTGRLMRVATALLPAAWGPRPDGRLVGFRPQPLANPQPPTVLSHRPGATASDTVIAFPLAPTERIMVPVRGRAPVSNPHPLAAETMIGWSADHTRFCGTIPANANAVRLRCVDDRGRSLLDRQLVLPPRPVTDAIYDTVIALFSRAPSGRTAADMRQRISRPRNLPPVLGMMVDNGGDIWLARSHTSEATARWLRLRSNGTIRDTVVFSAKYRIIRLQSDTAWATTADADDLQTLSRCRIRG